MDICVAFYLFVYVVLEVICLVYALRVKGKVSQSVAVMDNIPK